MTDEALKKVKPDKLRSLPAAFVKEGGTVTAGNSSIIADGAAALVLVSAERASELGLRVCCFLQNACRRVSCAVAASNMFDAARSLYVAASILC